MIQAITGYMTTKEAAEYLEYDPDYICQLCINGQLIGAKKFGNAWAIPEETVTNYPKPKERKKKEKTSRLAEINAAIREGIAKKMAANLAIA